MKNFKQAIGFIVYIGDPEKFCVKVNERHPFGQELEQ